MKKKTLNKNRKNSVFVFINFCILHFIFWWVARLKIHLQPPTLKVGPGSLDLCGVTGWPFDPLVGGHLTSEKVT